MQFCLQLVMWPYVLHGMKHWSLIAVLLGVSVQPITAQVVRDSAGVQIIENDGSSWGPDEAWRVGSTPSLEIGAVEGVAELLFSNVESVILASDGHVVVADRGSSEIRFFTWDGRFERSFGTEGEGPGEFRWLNWIGECRDGVVLAYDQALGRVTEIRLDSAPGETLPVRADGAGRAPHEVRCIEDGLVGMTRMLGQPPSTPGPVRWPNRVEFFAPGSDSRPIAEVPGDDRYLEAGDLGPRPLGRRTVIAAWGPLVAIGMQDAPQVTLHGVRSGLRRIVRWRDSGLALRAADVEAYVRGFVDRASSAEEATRIRSRFRGHPFPERLPAFGRLLFDRVGNLWVEVTSRPGQPRNSWRVISPSGALLGTVSLPAGFRPMFISTSHMAGVWRGDLDVEYVWVLEIRKSGHS